MNLNGHRRPLPVRHALDYVGVVKKLREDLLAAGYRHANAPGDLVSKDGTTWVSTTYTHGEYSVYAWRRPDGHGWLAEDLTRVVIRVTPATNPARVDLARNSLRAWAVCPPTADALWPPEGLAALR